MHLTKTKVPFPPCSIIIFIIIVISLVLFEKRQNRAHTRTHIHHSHTHMVSRTVCIFICMLRARRFSFVYSISSFPRILYRFSCINKSLGLFRLLTISCNVFAESCTRQTRKKSESQSFFPSFTCLAVASV